MERLAWSVTLLPTGAKAVSMPGRKLVAPHTICTLPRARPPLTVHTESVCASGCGRTASTSATTCGTAAAAAVVGAGAGLALGGGFSSSSSSSAAAAASAP